MSDTAFTSVLSKTLLFNVERRLDDLLETEISDLKNILAYNYQRPKYEAQSQGHQLTFYILLGCYTH